MNLNENKLLLHICCGPCAVWPTKFFMQENILFDGFFYNPNIHPKSEFDERLKNVQKLSEIREFDLIVDDEYLEELWLEYTDVPKRCQKCYTVRFQKAFEYAKNHNYKGVTTSLLVSPYQQHELIKKIANEYSKRYNIPFVYYDFRPSFRLGQQEAKELGLYRQKYCGCLSSLEDKLNFDIEKELKKGVTLNG